MDIKSIFDEKLNSISKELLHDKIKNDFIGLNTEYTVVSGKSIKRPGSKFQNFVDEFSNIILEFCEY